MKLRLRWPGLKRVFDIGASVTGLALMSPLFLAAAILIVLHDRGPVFFRQERIGKNAKPFRLYKFRSMRVLDDAAKGRFDAGDNSRVTPVGKILRKTKLDELPQLINVLRGEMSVVGPRPEVQKWVMVYPERWRRVLMVTPGITDYAAIEFRSEEVLLSRSEEPEKTYRDEVLPKKLELYEKYINNYSFARDLKLILVTMYLVVSRK